MKISKAVIISLPNSKRRHHVTQFVATWSLPFPVEIFNAVPKDECCSEIISVRGFTSRVDNSRMLEVEKRTLTPGEIGCMLSHYFVWKDVEGPTLILEDDFVFEYDSKTISNILSKVPEDFDICYFQQDINYLIVENINELFFKTFPNSGTFGYLINPKFSKKMVETFCLNRQADDYIGEFIMNQAPDTKIIASFLPFIKCGDFESEIGLRDHESFH
jgi:GR25 family glycosyltransferase involved in LPS biosynthesis